MGMIRARVSDELEQQIQERIEKLKENARGGMEVNMSTVIRYALEKYIKEQEELDKGVKTVKFDLNQCNDEEIEVIREMTIKLCRLQESKEKNKTEFYKQLASINTGTYEIELNKLRNKKEVE